MSCACIESALNPPNPTRLALEKEDLPAGIAPHAVAEEGIPFRQIAEAIGRGAGVEIESFSPESAAERFGFAGGLIGVDNPTSTTRTRELLNWNPSRPALLADLEEGSTSPRLIERAAVLRATAFSTYHPGLQCSSRALSSPEG